VHTLVVYGPSERADAALRELAAEASEGGGRVTVIALLAEEPEARGCCDTRSVLWNEITRGFANEDLLKARLALGDDEDVSLDVVAYSGRRAADAIVRAAIERGVDQVVLADPASTPLGPLARRRLRRRSPLPVRP
jgi:hypothetical protein